VPGSGGRSGAVVAMAWMPGFSSQEMIATDFPCLFDLPLWECQKFCVRAPL
jgi:hypothetical protein